MIKRFSIALFFILLAVFVTVKLIGRPTKFAPENIKAELEASELRYYLENAHPDTGLVRDLAENFGPTPDSNDMGSLAATGFGMAVFTNAATRGMVEPAFARDYTLKTLKFARDHVERRKGWFYHFANWKTGERYGRSEFSTIDTALFLAGAMYAAQVLKDQEIQSIVHQLHADLDFQDMLTDGGKQPEKRTLTMAYLPEDGYTTNQWGMYAEQKLLLLLGLSHPTHPLSSDTWRAFDRTLIDVGHGEKVMGLNEALFVHQYSELFVDFREFNDGFSNYFQNGASITRTQREMAHSQEHYKAFQLGFWGLSAGAAPNNGYEVWTASRHIGMVCLDCAISSAMFMPQEILADASAWAVGSYHDQIWGRYGFTDSIDLDRNWFATHVYGITKGPEFLSLANINNETSVWKDFMQIPEIQLALQRASIPGEKGPSQAETKMDGRKPGSLKK